ncbi:MAG: phosphatidylserine decarboxylase family protein [Gemmatimonadota bacterium]
MRFAREGRALILGATGVALVVFLAAAAWRHWIGWTLAGIAGLTAGAVVYFFRDPERSGPRGPHLVVAPADGRVVGIRALEEPTYVRGPATRVAIFLSVLDVHVNRYPVSGVVEVKEYQRGGFALAWRDEAGTQNERATLGLAAPRGRVLVRQIAGRVARRIVTYPAVGARVEQGERMGIIKFGSRVETFVPAGAEVLVREGDTVRGGVTVLARWEEV